MRDSWYKVFNYKGYTYQYRAYPVHMWGIRFNDKLLAWSKTPKEWIDDTYKKSELKLIRRFK